MPASSDCAKIHARYNNPSHLYAALRFQGKTQKQDYTMAAATQRGNIAKVTASGRTRSIRMHCRRAAGRGRGRGAAVGRRCVAAFSAALYTKTLASPSARQALKTVRPSRHEPPSAHARTTAAPPTADLGAARKSRSAGSQAGSRPRARSESSAPAATPFGASAARSIAARSAGPVATARARAHAAATAEKDLPKSTLRRTELLEISRTDFLPTLTPDRDLHLSLMPLGSN